jgi:predicted  nucleic acid-binding Zn-ribbon protein
LVLVILVAAVAACSSDSKSASEQVCESRSEFSSAVSKVGDDLKSANFGEARSNASSVQSTFSDLVDSFNKLTQEQRQQLQPQVDKVKSDVSSFSDVRNLDQLQTSIDTTQSDVQAVLDQIQKSLSC